MRRQFTDNKHQFSSTTVDMEEEYDYTTAEYEYDLGDSFATFHWEELAPTVVVYGLTLVLGLTGNCLIVFTTYRYRRMQTATNLLLSGLASADLLLINFCIPVKVLNAHRPHCCASLSIPRCVLPFNLLQWRAVGAHFVRDIVTVHDRRRPALGPPGRQVVLLHVGYGHFTVQMRPLPTECLHDMFCPHPHRHQHRTVRFSYCNIPKL